MNAGADPTARVRAAWLALFPGGVALRCCDESAPPPPLLGDEPQLVARAVPKRRDEFARGRGCAREALAELGCAPAEIPRGADRAPRWPDGFAGSITHCAGLVGAVAGPATAFRALALDAEPDEPLKPEIGARICTPAERERLATWPGLDAGRWQRAIFGAKECVHKCVAPLTGVTLEFHDVEIELDPDSGAFHAVPRTDRARALEPVRALRGGVAVCGRWRLCAAWVSVGRA